DQHPWFTASRARADGKADWYLWQDGRNGGPPNNWQSNFGGPAWTWDERRGQFYYHSFLPTQPDLNWRHPDVRRALYDALRFWLHKGVDGFRVDVLWMLIKDAAFRDNPPNPAWQPGGRPFDRFLPLYTADRPDVHEIVAEMRAVLDEFPARVLIGEIYLPIDKLVAYYGADGRGAQLPFNFHLLLLPHWTAPALADLITSYEAAIPPGAGPNWVLGNHARSGVATRLGPAQARAAAMLLLTLRGTPTLYMGDELGLEDTPIPPDRLRDPAELREPGQGLGRDPERTPYPWDDTPNRGFTTGTPWLPLSTGPSHAAQSRDPASVLSLHRRLLALRRASPILSVGALGPVTANGPILRYSRHLGRRLDIVLNTTGAPADTHTAGGTILADTHSPNPRALPPGPLRLEPDQGLLIQPE
ncbi:MAG: alpha-amylase family glycosyl hydrolase, partial [Acetobacteraceae bacterium]|nr:alpha-amylase family glycosyl hydrolase [Acetobacteraceae bacterium]